MVSMSRHYVNPRLVTGLHSWFKRVVTWSTLLLCALFVVSCDEEAINVDSINKQTVLVYMPWSGSETSKGLYNSFLANLDSIESAITTAGGLSKSRLLVFLSESATSSTLYEVTYSSQQGCEHKEVKHYTAHDYTTAEGISKVLSDANHAAYGLNFALIVGCHGTGWTHVDDWTDYPNNAKGTSSSQLPNSHTLNVKQHGEDTPYEETRFYGSVSDGNYAVDITTLAEGIKLSGLHMQYILFDDCYMANAEVAYELREVTNFLIASTSEVMAIGMPYADMWKSLASPTPSYSAAVSAFKAFYSSYRIPCGTLAAIDCRQMENLASVMRQINEHYTLDEELLETIQILDGFNTPIFFDLGDYVEKLCADPYLYEKFKTQLDKTVVSKAATSRIYSFLYSWPEYVTIDAFSGITISDPSQNEVALRGKSRTAWWQATHPAK